jgi:transcriptional regulator with XRE-family HTH domain
MTHGSLPERLRLLRAQRGLTLTEAAAQLGIGRHTLRRTELGTQTAQYPTLAKIAQGYGVPVEYLMEAMEDVPKAEASKSGQSSPKKSLLDLADTVLMHGRALFDVPDDFDDRDYYDYHPILSEGLLNFVHRLHSVEGAFHELESTLEEARETVDRDHDDR